MAEEKNKKTTRKKAPKNTKKNTAAKSPAQPVSTQSSKKNTGKKTKTVTDNKTRTRHKKTTAPAKTSGKSASKKVITQKKPARKSQPAQEARKKKTPAKPPTKRKKPQTRKKQNTPSANQAQPSGLDMEKIRAQYGFYEDNEDLYHAGYADSEPETLNTGQRDEGEPVETVTTKNSANAEPEQASLAVQEQENLTPAQMRKKRKQETLDYDEKQDVQMSFVSHLEELRKRFMYILLFGGFFTIIAIAFSEFLVEFLQKPYIENGKRLITTKPTGAFLTRLKVALISGFIVSLPFILHQIWMFVFPALSGRLRKLGIPLLLFAFVLFLTGVGFNYFVVLPFVIKALINMAWGGVEIIYNVNDYYDFVTMTSIIFGTIFEMPIVVLILVRAGLLTHRFLMQQWRMSLLIGAIGAAILTPPDAVSQLMMLLPMILLYLLSILIAFVFRRKDLEEFM